MNTCVVGLMWGDEGKGKIVDVLAESHDMVVRYNGGANAGHTVKVEDKVYKLHQIPSGVVWGKLAILADGMAINPVSLTKEIKENRISLENIKISNKAHIVMPWHIVADVRKGGKIGTTKKGIGPCYADKMHRWNAVRMGDLLGRLELEKVRKFFAADEILHGAGLWDEYCEAAEFLQPAICDTGKFLRSQVKDGKNILFESANGIQLDIDHGTFPYVTSSCVGPAAIPQSCGLPNLHLDRIVGVTKCYTTRVGEGPFPSEIKFEGLTKLIRNKGNEFGTTTGRPRRIGWLDLGILKDSIDLTGATELALMHIDTLADIKPVVLYNNGKFLEQKSWNGLDENFTDFCNTLQEELGIPVKIISFGPGRKDTLIL